MTRVDKRPLKLFISQHCSISYRQETRSSWTNEARNNYGVIYLLNGSLQLDSSESKWRVQPGSFTLVNPRSNLKSFARGATTLLIEVAPSLVVDCAMRTGITAGTNDVLMHSGEAIADARMTRLVEDVTREMINADKGHEIVIEALVDQIVILLLRHYSTVRRTETLELSRVGLVDRRIRRSIELMVAQLDQELSLRDLAAASYLSTFHFARLFKKLTGTTPHAYLAALRTSTAQKLLAETDLSVTEISSRVGYSTPSHFSKGFRQATGFTPRAFRAALISRNNSSLS